jgi:hypothetical protein
LDFNPDGDGPGSPWVGIVAVGDYGASLGVHPGLPAVAAAAFPEYYSPAKAPRYTPPSPLVIQGSNSLISSATATTNGMLPKNAALKFQDITDGLGNTVAVWESGGRPLVYRLGSPISTTVSTNHLNGGGWVRPASDIHVALSNKTGTQSPGIYINRTNGIDLGGDSYSGNGYTTGGWGVEGNSQPYSFHPGGLNLVLGDGAVKFLDEGTDVGIVAALTTRNGAGGTDANEDGKIDHTEYKEPVLDGLF